MEQNDLFQKIHKYMWILIAISLGMVLLSFLTPFLFRSFASGKPSAVDFDRYYFYILAARFTLGLIFSIVLYRDCREDIKNKYLVPLLGVAAPIVGTAFYFIEKYLTTKTYNHDN